MTTPDTMMATARATSITDEAVSAVDVRRREGKRFVTSNWGQSGKGARFLERVPFLESNV